MKTLALTCAALAAMMAGCSTITVKLEDGDTIVTDASKRLVVTSKNADGERIVCAEPSPDAVASLALDAALKAKVPQADVDAELAGSYARTLASIGLRTASIQILRDLGYRACEGVINNVIDKHVYRSLVAGVGDATIALVAIEGLTQMRPAPLVVVSPSGTASTASGATATTNAATINIQDAGKDFKPEELKNVAQSVVEIIRIIAIESVEARSKVRLQEAAAAAEAKKQRSGTGKAEKPQ